MNISIFKHIEQLRAKGDPKRAAELERFIESHRKMGRFFEGDPELKAFADSLRRSTRRLEAAQDD